MNNKLPLKLGLPYILCAAMFFSLSGLTLTAQITPDEQAIMKLSQKDYSKYKEVGVSPAEHVKISPESGRKTFNLDDDTENTHTEPEVQTKQEKPTELFTAFIVSLVAITEDRRYAIINGTLLREGAEFEGVQVKKIEQGAVLLAGKHRSEWIKLTKRAN
ncbi:MAG: general secretion pathway protein GspB [Nitrospirae bacterium YQR-1]